MALYMLRDLPLDIWNRAKARAQREGWPLRALLLRLLDDFGAGRITPSGQPPAFGPPPPPLSQLAETGSRVAVIRLRNALEERRVPVAKACEQNHFVMLFDDHDQVIGRFASADVESWSLE